MRIMEWSEVEQEVNKLASLVTQHPDVIVGITRGGLVPARLLAKHLEVKKMHCLSVAKSDGDRIVETEIKTRLDGQHVLLVEDVLESGRSLGVAVAYLESKGASVATACLYTIPTTEVTPTYTLGVVETVPSFPWE
eukprot:m.105266 g.105266  ORF g.105266 m.105266 type:complete len:136 (+) comp16861_c0_seq2:217-624(+)